MSAARIPTRTEQIAALKQIIRERDEEIRLRDLELITLRNALEAIRNKARPTNLDPGLGGCFAIADDALTCPHFHGEG